MRKIDDAWKYAKLRQAVLDYLSEYDNPVPDAVYRKTLRDRLRSLSGAPEEQTPHPPLIRPRRGSEKRGR